MRRDKNENLADKVFTMVIDPMQAIIYNPSTFFLKGSLTKPYISIYPFKHRLCFFVESFDPNS